MRCWLSPGTEGTFAHPYDELVRKLLQAGRSVFDRKQIQEVAQQEGLWIGRTIPEPESHRIGIRSFIRWAEQLEDETDELLNLLDLFDGRTIKSADLWHSSVYPSVAAFLRQHTRLGLRHHLHLHTHATVAFAAGYCLDSKSGVEVVPVQSTIHGRQLGTQMQLTASIRAQGGS